MPQSVVEGVFRKSSSERRAFAVVYFSAHMRQHQHLHNNRKEFIFVGRQQILAQGDEEATCLPGQVMFYYATCNNVKEMPQIQQVSCGVTHMMALTVDGLVMTCGDNSRGQLGSEWAIHIKSSSRFLVVYPAPEKPSPACNSLDSDDTMHNTPSTMTHRVRSIAAGAFVCGVIHENNELWMWGCNLNSQIAGVPTYASAVLQATPRVVRMHNDELFLVSSVSFGFEHCACIKTDDSLWTWGYNSYGKLGNDATFNPNNNNAAQHSRMTTIPKRIISSPVMTNMPVEVSCGGFQTLIRTANGSLWAAGCHKLGTGIASGNEAFAGTFRKVPISRRAGDRVRVLAMAAGKTHSAIVTTDNIVMKCGKMKCAVHHVEPRANARNARGIITATQSTAGAVFTYTGFGGLGYFGGLARQGYVNSFRLVQQLTNSMGFYHSFSKETCDMLKTWLLGIYVDHAHDSRPNNTFPAISKRRPSGGSSKTGQKLAKHSQKDTRPSAGKQRRFSHDHIFMNSLAPDVIDYIMRCLRTERQSVS